MKTRFATWEYPVPAVGAAEAAQAASLPMDNEQFAGFYERTARPLWAYLARISGDPALAEDLLQESYVRFLGARIPDGEVACRRYLFRIGTNLLRDHWRRPAAAPLESIAEPSHGPEQQRACDHMDSVALLGPALEQMKPRDRQMLWLAYAEGASHREIAEIMGLGAGSIRLLLFRARRKLARLLRSQGQGQAV